MSGLFCVGKGWTVKPLGTRFFFDASRPRAYTHRPNPNAAAMSLDRNLTHPAVVEYLESLAPLAPLATYLIDTVDGNADRRREAPPLGKPRRDQA
eukprot:7272707-Prymnesium_polylepis.1